MPSTILETVGRAAAALLLLCTVAATSGAAGSPDQSAAEAAPALSTERLTYVTRAECTGCHPKEARLWSGSHHDRAMEKADDKSVLGDFGGAEFAYFGITSRFFKKNGKFFVRTDGPDGGPADFEIAYTFGVDPLQQYLIPFPGGRLQCLTIAWDSRPKARGGQRWFHLYADEKISHGDPLHWTGAEQNWNFTCATCHSTNLKKNYDARADRYDTKWSEIDVSCEACHGPGSRHVAWAKARAKGKKEDGGDGLTVHLAERTAARWVMNPKTGNASLATPPRTSQIEVCAPCHSRRSAISDDFTPGQPLLDSYVPVLLSPGLYHADGQIEGEVYEYGSFLQSKMQHSGVVCSDCHDPHGLALRASGNALCTRCHEAAKYDAKSHHFHPPGSPGSTCVGCHMPTTTYMVVDPRRDHSLRIPRPDLSVALGTPNACNKCHADESAAWAAGKVREWYGHTPAGYQTYAAALHAGRDDSPQAADLLARLIRDDSQPGIARATALSLLSRYLTPASLPVLRIGLGDPDPLVRRAALGALEPLPVQQRLPLAGPLLSDPIRAVRIEAVHQLAALPGDALPPALRSQLDRGVAEYVAAQEVDADRPEAHTNLGTFYAQRGRRKEAEIELRTAIRMRPDFTPAYVNLADLYRVEKRDAEGERVLRQGLSAAPGDAALHHALGLLLVREKRNEEAVEELRRAATLEPADARYAYVLGVALHSAGKTASALETLKAAHDRHPADRQILWALATISRDVGDRDAARRWATDLAALDPEDPAARQLLQALQPTP
jgi:predicted CXXCH cytochrome family protein